MGNETPNTNHLPGYAHETWAELPDLLAVLRSHGMAPESGWIVEGSGRWTSTVIIRTDDTPLLQQPGPALRKRSQAIPTRAAPTHALLVGRLW